MGFDSYMEQKATKNRGEQLFQQSTALKDSNQLLIGKFAKATLNGVSGPFEKWEPTTASSQSPVSPVCEWWGGKVDFRPS